MRLYPDCAVLKKFNVFLYPNAKSTDRWGTHSGFCMNDPSRSISVIKKNLSGL